MLFLVIAAFPMLLLAQNDATALLDRAVVYIRANAEQFPEWRAEVKVQKGGSVIGGILF